MDRGMREKFLEFQRNEITEHLFYKRLAAGVADTGNKEVLEQIAADELRHYGFWKSQTGVEVRPSRLALAAYTLLASLFGLTFASKLMERGEIRALKSYEQMRGKVPEIEKIIADEKTHELGLLRMLKEKRLTYVSSIVLGLNDALVELTGTLAGLTFAFQNSKIIAVSGFVTGIAASLSMAASEYLSNKSAGAKRKDAIEASVYTGIAYIAVVLLLIAPYFILPVFWALGATIIVGLLIIAVFSFYVAIVQETSFRRHASEMAALALGIAALSFGIGVAARELLGLEM